MRTEPLKVINKLVKEHYIEAKAIFWSGSVSKNEGTKASDLDLVIIYDTLANAYREAFIYENWPIDAFVLDIESLRYFLKESKEGSGISGLAHMILNSRIITQPTDFSQSIIVLAEKILESGPKSWNQEEIDKERFLITDVLEDILSPKNRAEQIASTAWLYEALSQFYFRSQNKWRASGKFIIRYLENDNPQLARKYIESFEKIFQTGDATDLKELVISILAPYGGLLWDGFRSETPQQTDKIVV